MFYLAGIRLVKRYDEGESQYACYLVTLTFLAEAAAITLNVLGYVFTYKNVNDNMEPFQTDCIDTLWVNIISSFILVALPIIQFFNCNPQNSLLTTALVSMYISYLSMIAQFSYDNGNKSCNRMGYGPLVADVIVSTFFFIVTMYGSVMGGSGQVAVSGEGDITEALGVARSSREGDQEQLVNNAHKNEEEENEEKYTNSWLWVKWHFYMCLAAVYVGMLITNWNSASIYTGEMEQSSFGFWVRVVMSWVTFLLYVWTLAAPRVFPDRDFTVE